MRKVIKKDDEQLLKLEVGKTYISQNYEVVKIEKESTSNSGDTYPFKGDNGVWYTKYGSGQHGSNLVKEFVNPPISDMHKSIYQFSTDLMDGSDAPFLKGDGMDNLSKPKGNTRVFETGSRRDDDSNKPLVNHLDAYVRLRFGYLLRQGAHKYDKGNWKKGQPTETALECLHRHLAKFELNLQNGIEQDEDHLAAIIFNVMLIMKNEEKEGITVDHYYGTLK